MKCGMCEAHINDLMRNHFKIKKVSSSHLKNETIMITDEEISEDILHDIIDPTGYKLLNMERLEAKKTFFWWK